MAIRWGTPRTDSTNGFRVGYEFTQSPSTITSATTRVVVTVRLYVGTMYPIIDSNNTFAWSGSFGSGSQSVSINARSSSRWSSSNVTHVKTLSRTFTAVSSDIASWVSASLTGIEVVAGRADVTGSITTDGKPDAPITSVPNNPTEAQAFRGSDEVHTIEWRNNSTSTKPYQHIRIERWDSVTNEYRQVAHLRNVGISVSKWTDRGTQANRRYRWTVYAENSAGSSGWAATNFITTSPLKPTNFKAEQMTDGTVELTWDSSHIHGLTAMEVLEKIDGTTWGEPVDIVGPEVTSWVAAPNLAAETRQYAIRAVAGTDDPVVKSPFVYSWELQSIRPPLAPVTVAPVGAAAVDEDVELVWEHTTLDGSAQSSFELQHREAGTETWTTVTGTLEQSYVLPEGTYAANDQVEWQVRTWGTHVSASPWSDIDSFVLSRKPTVTINPSGLWGLTEHVQVDWTYGDPDGDAQGAWAVQILSPDSVLMEERTGTGTASSALMETYLYDDTSYTVRVRVRDVPGLWSDWASETLEVDYAPPQPPTITAVFDEDNALMEISVFNPPGLVPVALSRLERQTDDGWVIVDNDVPSGGTAIDPLPVFGEGTVNRYRVESEASSGESAYSEILEVHVNPKGCDQWFWLNAGPDFSLIARFRGNPAVGITRGREKALGRYVGRNYPLEYGSDQLVHVLDVSGTLESNKLHSSEEDFVAVTEAIAPVCYRDVKGRRVFGSISNIDFGEIDFNRFMDVAFTLERTEYTETDA